MNIHNLFIIILIIVITLLSGLGDSQGFFHSSNVWHNGKIVWMEIGRSAMGFGFGIIMFWVVVKFLQEFGIVSPEIQTIGWFAVTIIGVALTSGKFFQWHLVDQTIALALLIGLSVLSFRTGG